LLLFFSIKKNIVKEKEESTSEGGLEILFKRKTKSKGKTKIEYDINETLESLFKDIHSLKEKSISTILSHNRCKDKKIQP